jgi:hypothetical protein
MASGGRLVIGLRGFGLSWGRQSCLQAAFQAAVETEQTIRGIRNYFLRLRVSQRGKAASRQLSAISPQRRSRKIQPNR